MTEQYIEQIVRVRRYLRRLQSSESGGQQYCDSNLYRDDLYAFFQNCYHLKDWIKNDPACASWVPNVESFVSDSSDLRVCADLCNAQKHLDLKWPRSNEAPHVANVLVTIVISDGLDGKEKIQTHAQKIVSKASGDEDALDLAQRCVRQWEDFIRSNGGRIE